MGQASDKLKQEPSPKQSKERVHLMQEILATDFDIQVSNVSLLWPADGDVCGAR
jgi:hypothetical protein